MRRPEARSKVSNGSVLVPGCDQRSRWVRRAKDVIQAISINMGGEPELTEAQRAIIRRCAVLIVELERMESRFASDGEASPTALDLYQRTANSLRRLLEAVGIDRRPPRDITPDLRTYLANRSVPDEAAA